MKSLLVIFALGLAGCATGPSLQDYGLSTPRIELDQTPFFAQSEFQCGPAALATVLNASGISVIPETLVDSVYIPERQGSLQTEMIATTRRFERIPYVLERDFRAILTEVAAGNPVLVMQNLALRMFPRWHYAVIIGYDSDADTVILRSGTKKRLILNRVRFEATWARADHWAIVTVDPENPPPTADYLNWLTSVSPFEELGRSDIAATAYEAATLRWPEQPLVWQALANAYYAQDNLPAAERALRHSLQLEASAAGHNNLAYILLMQGCTAQAQNEIRMAETMPGAEKMAEVLAHTRHEIESAPYNQGDACSSDK